MFTQLFINSIIAGSIYTLIALGFSLIYSTTKFFHFAHAANLTPERIKQAFLGD